MTIVKKTVAISAIALVVSTAGLAAGNMKDRFKEADRDNNGVITHDEMMARVQFRFAAFDKNGDGYLVLAELPREMPVPEQMEKRMKKKAARMQERLEQEAEREGREFDAEAFEDQFVNRKPTRLRFVARLDQDGDEKVSIEEFSHRAVRMFKHADLDGNGEVTKNEAKQAMKNRYKKHKERGGRRHG